ncbi:MAG: hypothetical protein QOJ13_3347 [Gaiellales bacterium]|jgi:uncharacterized cupin superfamily protein|nr:hypothetical protein [Gaiellales bacterium]
MTGITQLDPAALHDAPLLQEGEAMSRTSELARFADGLTAGVWSADAFVEHLPSYPVDEVCVLIEGSVTLRTPDGAAATFGPGEAFAIARCTECTWEQTGPVRKFYVIRECED